MEGFLKQSTAVNITVLLIDSSDHVTGKTGLAAGLTIYATKGAGTPGVITPTVTELDATNVKGVYKLALTTGHTDTLGELQLHITAAGADPTDLKWQVSARLIDDLAFPATSGRSMVVDAAGLVDANAVKLGPTGSGTTQTGRDIGASVLLSAGTGAGQLDFTSGVVKSNLAQILGTALTETAGQIAAAFKKLFDVASPVLTATSVNQTGDNYARLGAPAGASVSADVAAVKAALPTALAADGSIKASVQSFLGTAFTEGAAGRIAAAFKQFFNIASPAATMDHGILVDTATTATTATNLTNAPTAGDFTAAMKTSLNAATPAVTVSDKTGFSLTAAYDAAKTAAQAGDAMALTSGERTTLAAAIWNALTSGLTTAGSIGKLLVDNINATISSRLPTSSYIAPLNAAATAAAVWDEPISGHLTAGTTGASLNAAGSAGDPWATALPGAYGAGTAGKIVGDNLDAKVSTRSTYAGGDTAGTTTLLSRLSAARAGYLDNLSAGAVALEASLQGLITTIGAAAAGVAAAVWGAATRVLTAGTNIALAKGVGVTGFTDLDASGVRSAVGLASANLDTQLAAIDSDVISAAGAVNSTVLAVKSKTDNLPAAPAAVSDIPTASQNADKVLGRNLAGGADGGRTVQDALRLSRNRRRIHLGLLEVYAEDDSTLAWSAPVTTAAGDPLIEVDPT